MLSVNCFPHSKRGELRLGSDFTRLAGFLVSWAQREEDAQFADAAKSVHLNIIPCRGGRIFHCCGLVQQVLSCAFLCSAAVALCVR